MKTILILFLALITIQANAQMGSCVIVKKNAVVIPKDNLQKFQRASAYNEPYCVKVYFTVFADNDGSNRAASDDAIYAQLLSMTLFYHPLKICFLLVGIRQINNSDWNIQDADNEYDEMKDLRVPNCLNIFIHKELFVSTGSIGGIAYDIPNPDAIVSLKGLSFSNPDYMSITAHEVGHVFGLYHTFEIHPGDPFHGAESVARSGDCKDCDTDGDLLCDTPADYNSITYLNDNTNSNCDFTGNVKDECGVTYAPSTHNIMSYGRITCLNEFTNGQGERMRYFIANDSDLQSILAPNSDVQFLPTTISSGTGWGVARDLFQILPSTSSIIYNGTANYTFQAKSIIISRGTRFTPSTNGKIHLTTNPYCN